MNTSTPIHGKFLESISPSLPTASSCSQHQEGETQNLLYGPSDQDFKQLKQTLAHYLSPEEIILVERAYEFSKQAHHGQMRTSGEAYISHPLAVAAIAAEAFRLDAPSIIAALLHDVLEDTAISKSHLSACFGENVAELVDGLSKLDSAIHGSKAASNAASFHKLLVSATRDVRVILIKLSDRLHNMRTLGALSPEKQHRIATETLDLYAPIARKIGTYQVYRQLNDACFKALFPNRAKVFEQAVEEMRRSRLNTLAEVVQLISHRLKEANLNARIEVREKHLYSIFKKMQNQKIHLQDIIDLHGLRIIILQGESQDCYRTLGVVHSLPYRVLPGKLKDYIANPKQPNGYRALHTTLLVPGVTPLPLEIQIRTEVGDCVAEYGIAAQWACGCDFEINIAPAIHGWLHSLVDIYSEVDDMVDSLNHVKSDITPTPCVQALTPKGKLVTLPDGATVLDFAFAIHTQMGLHCTGGEINNRHCPSNTPLRTGDVVKILTDDTVLPATEWLSFVKTGKASAVIRNRLSKPTSS